jgi:hypothetical protein
MSTNVLDLGVTTDELREQVVERAAANVAERILSNYEDYLRPIRDAVQNTVKAAADTLAEETLRPLVTDGIEALLLQETNQWGEKKGEPVTFREYMVQRAEAYLREPVNYQGHNKAESRDSYSWKGTQTRLTHMIHQHLHYEIERAMKSALEMANGQIARGIHETARLKLNEIASQLKVEVKS